VIVKLTGLLRNVITRELVLFVIEEIPDLEINTCPVEVESKTPWESYLICDEYVILMDERDISY
jgi:hypothetical protein